jgi:hypothetical protein
MTRKLSLQSSSIAALAGVFCFAVTVAFRAEAANPAGRVAIEYVEPKNPAHRPIYDELKQARALERVQELLSPFRLPRQLLLKTTGCDGVSNAWYEENALTVCYEFIADILKNAPEQASPEGITRKDAILGPMVDVFLHESGHAMFDLLKVPVFGREEDAADTFSAYITLHFPKEEARRLILGSAYQYKMDLKDPQVTMPITKFSNVHGTPAQRFYNVLCIAYGADKKLFADLVEKKYLPEDRADGCEDEYEQAAFAFRVLIDPHIDKARAKQVLHTWTRKVDAPRRRRPPGK